MNAIDVAALHDLIRRLPLPMAVLGSRAGVGYANERFTELFQPGQLDDPGLRRLVHGATDTWHAVTLRRHDGRDLAARAWAVAVADGVLLAFDGDDDPALARENERLLTRIADLESLSATDPLTGAWNRLQLERVVDVEISRARRSGQPVTLVLLDIDHFKRVNDAHGHLAGDAVLTELVGRIRERMRATDSLFRWGGEEFVVLATSVGYRGGAVVAESLRRAIAAEPFAKVGPITASLGVAEYMEGESAASWFQRTDRALYAAKSAGRNRTHVDRMGSSDLQASRTDAGVLRLYWLEAYECGDPSIDAEHRELFDLGNALIGVAMEQHTEPGAWRAALDSMLAHLTRHFRDEEALLDRLGYPRLAEHRRAHADLLTQAGALRAAVDDGEATLGHLVNFLVNDVVALHVLRVDLDFYRLVRAGNDGGADRARVD